SKKEDKLNAFNTVDYKLTEKMEEDAKLRENFEKLNKMDEDTKLFDKEKLGLMLKMWKNWPLLIGYKRAEKSVKDAGITIKQFNKLARTLEVTGEDRVNLFIELLPYLGLKVSSDDMSRMKEAFNMFDAVGYGNVKVDKIKQLVEAKDHKDRNKILNDEIIKKNKSVDKAITKIMTGLGKEIKVGKEINPEDINNHVLSYIMKSNKELKAIESKIAKHKKNEEEVPEGLTMSRDIVMYEIKNSQQYKAIFDFSCMLLGAFGEKDRNKVALKEIQESLMSRYGSTKGIKDYSLGAIMDLYEKYKSWGITMDDIYRSYGISGNGYDVKLQKYLGTNMKKMKQEDIFIIPWLTTISDIEKNKLPEISILIEQIKNTKQMITRYTKKEVRDQGFGRLLDKKNENKISIKFDVASITDEKDKANRGNMYCDKDHIGIDARMVADIMTEMQGVSPEHVRDLIKRKTTHEIGHLRDQINAFRIAERDDATNVWRFKKGGLEEVETYMTKTVKALFRIALKRMGKDDAEVRKIVNSASIKMKEHKKDGKYLYSIKLKGKGLKDSGLDIPENMLKGTMKLEGVTIIEFLANMKLVSSDVEEFKKNVAYALWYDMRVRLRMMNGDFDNHEQVYNQAKQLMENMKELGLLGHFMSFGVDHADYQKMFALDIAREIVDINKAYNDAREGKRVGISVRDAAADRPAKQAEVIMEEPVEKLPIAAKAEDERSFADVSRETVKSLIGEDLWNKMVEKDRNFLSVLIMNNPQDKEFEDIKIHLETQGFVVSRGADATAIKLPAAIDGKWWWVKVMDNKEDPQAVFDWHVDLKSDIGNESLWEVVAEYDTEREWLVVYQIDAGDDLELAYLNTGQDHSEAAGELIDRLSEEYNLIFDPVKLQESSILKNIGVKGNVLKVIDIPSLRYARDENERDQAVAAAKAKIKDEYSTLASGETIEIVQEIISSLKTQGFRFYSNEEKGRTRSGLHPARKWQILGSIITRLETEKQNIYWNILTLENKIIVGRRIGQAIDIAEDLRSKARIRKKDQIFLYGSLLWGEEDTPPTDADVVVIQSDAVGLGKFTFETLPSLEAGMAVDMRVPNVIHGYIGRSEDIKKIDKATDFKVHMASFKTGVLIGDEEGISIDQPEYRQALDHVESLLNSAQDHLNLHEGEAAYKKAVRRIIEAVVFLNDTINIAFNKGDLESSDHAALIELVKGMIESPQEYNYSILNISELVNKNISGSLSDILEEVGSKETLNRIIYITAATLMLARTTLMQESTARAKVKDEDSILASGQGISVENNYKPFVPKKLKIASFETVKMPVLTEAEANLEVIVSSPIARQLGFSNNIDAKMQDIFEQYGKTDVAIPVEEAEMLIAEKGQLSLQEQVLEKIAIVLGKDITDVREMFRDKKLISALGDPVLQVVFRIRGDELVGKQFQMHKALYDRLPEIWADPQARTVLLALMRKESLHHADGVGYDLLKLKQLKNQYHKDPSNVDVALQFSAVHLHFEMPKYKRLYDDIVNDLGQGDVSKAIMALDELIKAA
ncbi:MAG: hypothetical protein H8D54_03850, partial [Candidatus Omnitrophica bacterium]|nr:hypothetical protein [Candidatus Omnitrophota bacterium]